MGCCASVDVMDNPHPNPAPERRCTVMCIDPGLHPLAVVSQWHVQKAGSAGDVIIRNVHDRSTVWSVLFRELRELPANFRRYPRLLDIPASAVVCVIMCQLDYEVPFLVSRPGPAAVKRLPWSSFPCLVQDVRRVRGLTSILGPFFRTEMQRFHREAQAQAEAVSAVHQSAGGTVAT